MLAVSRLALSLWTWPRDARWYGSAAAAHAAPRSWILKGRAGTHLLPGTGGEKGDRWPGSLLHSGVVLFLQQTTRRAIT